MKKQPPSINRLNTTPAYYRGETILVGTFSYSPSPSEANRELSRREMRQRMKQTREAYHKADVQRDLRAFDSSKSYNGHPLSCMA